MTTTPETNTCENGRELEAKPECSEHCHGWCSTHNLGEYSCEDRCIRLTRGWDAATLRTPALPGDLTAEQLELAAQALHDRQWRGSDTHPRWGEGGHCKYGSAHRDEVFADALAVLAAARVAPVTPSDEVEHLRASVKHVADQMAEARATLQMFDDRIDEHVFQELASALDDQPLDFETGEVVGKAKPAPSPDRAELIAEADEWDADMPDRDQRAVDLIRRMRAALAVPPVVNADRIRTAVAKAVSNANNHPEPAQVLGRSLSALIDATTEAVLKELSA